MNLKKPKLDVFGGMLLLIAALVVIIIAFAGVLLTTEKNEVIATPVTLPNKLKGIDTQLNQIRSDNGLESLTLNNDLNQSATDKANDMLANKYFSHDSPRGLTPWYWFYKNDIHYKHAGENLSKCYSPDEAVTAWLESPEHKANVLGDYSEFGFGYTMDGDCMIIVNHFRSLK